MRRSLARQRDDHHARAPSHADTEDTDDDQALLLPKHTKEQEYGDESSSSYDDQLVEPMSWPAMAYTSYLWWASAGERRSDLQEEIEGDEALLSGIEGSDATSTPRRRSASEGLERTMMAPEMVLIAYFHRLTTLCCIIVKNSPARAIVRQ